MADLTPAQLEAIEAALAAPRPDTTILPPPPSPDASDADDWAEMRVERRGHDWRAVWRERNGVEMASEWRPRERWYTQLSIFLGKLRNFTMKGHGKIPLHLNPPRPRDENP